jgi:hypothetical protein
VVVAAPVVIEILACFTVELYLYPGISDVESTDIEEPAILLSTVHNGAPGNEQPWMEEEQKGQYGQFDAGVVTADRDATTI